MANQMSHAYGAPVASDEINGVLIPKVKLMYGANGSATDLSPANPLPTQGASQSRSDTYTGTATGTTVNASSAPVKSFSMVVKGTGAAATSWTVVLEGSLNNVNFTTLLTHSNTDGDGVLKSTTSNSPVLYYRTRCTAVTLGSATNIVTTILGMD